GENNMATYTITIDERTTRGKYIMTVLAALGLIKKKNDPNVERQREREAFLYTSKINAAKMMNEA
ncbi:MAG: hypothetical protein II575_01670, partial [Bacteroidales bacterium]|nr:hypothetical protein [Bacteroidales bacterium]